MPAEEDKRSRRAKRRAAQQAETPDESGRADADVEAARAEATTDADSAEPDETKDAPSEPRAKPKKRSQTTGTEAIRDRNKRVREQAAQRRRAERDQSRGVRARPAGLDTTEMVDDALVRSTHALTTFLRQHFNLVQWAIVILLVGGLGWQIYSWRKGKTEARASDELHLGIEAEFGKVGAPPPTASPKGEEFVDPRPTYPDHAARLKAAEEAYRKAAETRPGSGSALLATLGLAGVLYDQGKLDEALSSYEVVRKSELAVHDADVRGRSIEGIGLTLEAKGDREGALKAFRELENSDIPGLNTLGVYHQARLAFAKGERDKAKELVGKVREKLEKSKEAQPTSDYLDEASAELLRQIDPKAAPAKASSLSLEQLQKIEEQIKGNPEQLKRVLEEMGLKGGIPGDPAAPPVPGAPDTPAGESAPAEAPPENP